MKIEKLTADKIKIHLSTEDLADQGLDKEDLWDDAPKIYDFFVEIMETAYEEVGFEVTGPILVEISSMIEDSIIITVSKSNILKSIPLIESDSNQLALTENTETEDQIEVNSNAPLIFKFKDFEDLIAAVGHTKNLLKIDGKVISYCGYYFWILESNILKIEEQVKALLLEFGEKTTISCDVLSEYGNVVIEKDVASLISDFFLK